MRLPVLVAALAGGAMVLSGCMAGAGDVTAPPVAVAAAPADVAAEAAAEEPAAQAPRKYPSRAIGASHRIRHRTMR
jgi:hypothetical protein